MDGATSYKVCSLQPFHIPTSAPALGPLHMLELLAA